MDINDEITLGRCMTPTELVATIKNGEFIEFSWTKSKGATEFLLELYSDEAMEKKVAEKTILADELPYLWDLDADMVYYARVKAVDGDRKIKDSNWAVYDRKLETYAIKSSLTPELVDRTVNSITIKWTKDPEVDHIRITPALSEGEEYTRFEVNAEAVEAGQVAVTGLNPSINYTLAVHFKSADRGKVTAWTRPSTEGATEVATSEALLQAITDKAAVIKVAYSETPYAIGSVALGGNVAIYGDATAEGAQPVIQGGLKISADVTKVHLEALTFDGLSSTDYPHNLTFDAAAAVESITVVNCNLNNYVRGILYENSKNPSIDKIHYNGVVVNNVAGTGGDCFDFRGTSYKVGEIIFENSTLNIGARTWFRLDWKEADKKLGTLESISVTNCTFNNLCFINDGNNNGIFNINATTVQKGAPKFVLKKNVFLNMQDSGKRCCLIAKNSTNVFPSELADNFFFNCSDRFFIPQKDGSALSGDDLTNAATAGRALILVNGSAELAADPCVDSGRDKLNVTNADVLKAGAGDPRWHTVYVEVPEDLTQAVTATGKIWNLTDGQTFKKLADKDMVRDGIRFYVKNTPINFVKTGFEFSGAAAVGEDGIPADGAIGIKVNEPGSIVISVAESSAHSNLTVSLDGKVAAAVPAGAEYQKITFANVSGEQMIYIYGCHPATMTFLQWTSDVQVLDKVLATPVVKINKTTVNERAEDNITLTWDAINFAGSYNVTVDGKVKNVTETTYTFSTAGFAVEEAGGDFAIQVTAVPAATDYTRVESAAAELSFHVNDVPEEAGEPAGIAGVISFDDYIGTSAAGTLAREFQAGSIKLSIVADTNNKMVVDANTASFGTAEAQNKYTTRFKTGSGSGDASGLKLTVDAKGTLKFAVRTGSNSSVRYLYVSASGNELLSCELDETKQKHTVGDISYYDYFTLDVDAGEYDLTYSGAVNIYAIEYIPAATSVDYVWDFSAAAWVNAITASGIAINTNDSNWNLEVDGLKMLSGGGSIKWNTMTFNGSDLYYFQIGGGGSETKRYFEFTAEAPGTVSVYASGTNDDMDQSREVVVKAEGADAQSAFGAYKKSEGPVKIDYDVTSAGVVKVYTNASLIIYKIEYHSK